MLTVERTKLHTGGLEFRASISSMGCMLPPEGSESSGSRVAITLKPREKVGCGHDVGASRGAEGATKAGVER